ncbi:hypothetical protein [Burkholderia sp. MSMB1826]|uniref:hypothetical protein n=1 Tax=Burkholderia sp. MSMB1826 TaxID=1637875 RepID=UPI0012E3A15D|nr:hypothetical protein [Burkholderia sp. MSMB1826]
MLQYKKPPGSRLWLPVTPMDNEPTGSDDVSLSDILPRDGQLFISQSNDAIHEQDDPCSLCQSEMDDTATGSSRRGRVPSDHTHSPKDNSNTVPDDVRKLVQQIASEAGLPPPTSESSERGNISSHFDASVDLSPERSTGLGDSEISDEREPDRDAGDEDSDGSRERSSSHRDPTLIDRGDRPLTHTAPDRKNPADLLIFQHEFKNTNRFSSNTETTILGVYSKSQPPRPLTLGNSGPRLTTVPQPEPAAAGSVDPPPSARAEGGMKKDRKLRALRAFSCMLMPAAMIGSESTPAMRGKARLSQLVPALTTTADLEARTALLFPNSNDDHIALAALLRTALGASGPEVMPISNRTELTFTHHQMIAECLARATGGDVARALRAFTALQRGEFLPFSSINSGDSIPPIRLKELLTLPPDRSSRAQPQLDALNVAASLASSPIGFEGLLRALKPALPEDRQPHLKRLLEAVDKVATERGAPGDIANHLITARSAMETGQATLAQHVLHIESRALEHFGLDTHATLSPEDKAAVFSWDNGFRDRGPGTELAKVQGRLAKMGKYVQRAKHLQDLRNVKFDGRNPVRSTAKVIEARARILAMRAQQTVGRKKSPLTGLRRFGANNNLLKHPDEDPAVLDANTIAAVKMVHTQYASAVDRYSGFDVKLQDPREKALPEPVLIEALLAHWQSRIEEGGMRPIGLKLDAEALNSIAQYIATRHGVDTPATRELIRERLHRWTTSTHKGWTLRRGGDRELTLRDLEKWAVDMGMPTRAFTPLGKIIAGGTPPRQALASSAVVPEPDTEGSSSRSAVADGSPTYIEETEFGTALRKALNIVDSSVVRPDDLTPDGLHRFTRMYLLEHPWGNPLVASNGGSAGINTSAVALSIHKVAEKFMPLSVTPILDLRLSRSNNAILSIGSTTHGGEIFLGTQRQIAGSVGGGLFGSIGPKALRKILGQGTGSAQLTPLAVESVKTRGVMVRALRPQNPDGSGHDTGAARTELVQFNDLMWSVAKGEHGDLEPAAIWELIADRFFGSDTLSIGWQDQEASTVRHAFSASVGLRGGHSIGRKIAGAFSNLETERVGLSAGIATDLTTLGANRRNERTGRNRMMRANYLWRFQANATLAATQTNPPIPASHAVGPNTASIASGPSSITRTFALDDRGFNATFRTIMKSGKLSEPFTLREFEERDAKQFAAAMTRPERRAQLLQMFKASYGHDSGEQQLDNFLTKIRNWAGAGQHYVIRYRMRAEDRKTLDELAAYAHLVARRDPSDPVLANIERAMKERLEDEDTWIPIQTFSLEGQTAREALGINLGVQFGAQSIVASDRELAAVVVPLPIADQWTQIRRNEHHSERYPWATTEESGAEDRRAGT